MKIILGRREIMAGVQLPGPNVYAFSELGAKKTVSGEQRRQQWATAEGVFRVVSPVAEGQNREGFAGGREVFWRPPEELVGLHQWGAGGRALSPMRGQLWSQTDLDSVLFCCFTWGSPSTCTCVSSSVER